MGAPSLAPSIRTQRRGEGDKKKGGEGERDSDAATSKSDASHDDEGRAPKKKEKTRSNIPGSYLDILLYVQ